MTSLELTDKEKDVFLNWLEERQKIIYEEIELLKTIRFKLENKVEVKKIPDQKQISNAVAKKTLSAKTDDSSSWVATIKKELNHFTSPVPSGEIVKRLLEKSSFADKGKRFITKAVTSKLWLLQERGEVSKTRENGRYVYALTK